MMSFLLPVYPSISIAKNIDEKMKSIIIYEDNDKLVTTKIPNELSENKEFLNRIRSEYLKNSNEKNNSFKTDNNITPYYVLPEKPEKPSRKLISVDKMYSKQVKQRLESTKEGRKIINEVLNNPLTYATTALADYLTGKSFTFFSIFLSKLYNYRAEKEVEWLSESLAMMIKGEIRYIELKIYENLSGEYPKVFIERKRIK